MKYFMFTLWNSDLADCYHETGAIETFSTHAYEDRDECIRDAEAETKALQEAMGDTYSPGAIYYIIQEVEIKPKGGNL